MFKKFMTKKMEPQVFPNVIQTKAEMIEDDKSCSKSITYTPSQIVEALLANTQFINDLIEAITANVLENLVQRYEFEPTDRYMEDVANKKRYLGQLDLYLQERKEINNMVENELGNFLQQTSANLTKALAGFTTSIQNQIRVAETKHGIDMIKHSIFTSNSLDKEISKHE